MRLWMMLPDDHHRHDLQGAAAGDPRPRHRRPSRRSGGAELPRLQSEDVGVLHRHLRPARRRLGRQEDRGRRVGDGVPERRRHPQRPERAGRGEIPDHGGALRAHSGFRRRRPPPRRPRHRADHARADQRHGQHPERALGLSALGPRRRRRGHRQQGGVPRRRRAGRTISPTPRCWWRSSSRATRSASRRAAAAATARRSSGRSRTCARTCGRAMCR